MRSKSRIHWTAVFRYLGYEQPRPDLMHFHTLGGAIQINIDCGLSKIQILYDMRDNFCMAVSHNYDVDNGEELLSLLRALAKPELLPLCLNIKWALPVIHYLLTKDY